MFALFHLDAVLVIPFAGEGEEEIGMLPSKHAEPVLVAESQFHLVPKIGFVLKWKICVFLKNTRGKMYFS